MPLQHSSSDSAFKTNVKTLMGEVGKSPHVKSRNQALAIAYAVKRRGRATGGSADTADASQTGNSWRRQVERSRDRNDAYAPLPKKQFQDRVPQIDRASTFDERFNAVSDVKGRALGGLTKPPQPSWITRTEARSMLHSGPIASAVPGRTDRHNVTVGSGAYVMPADSVSHLGQNNTKAGHAILNSMFGTGGPYGTKGMAPKHGAGVPKAPALKQIAGFKVPKFSNKGGGRGDDRVGRPVPIVVAGGEFTISPEIVAAIGGGDVRKGHKILDQWVLSLRKDHIKKLKSLPPPAKA
jgi:hypothetical protein